ncbi:MAG: HxsD-like protein [Candidatus Woesearchaeota archaeon]
MAKVEIDKDNKEVKLYLDTRFYDNRYVMLAAKAFAESCWVYLDGDVNDKLQVCLKPKSDDIKLETVGYEFYNYVLGLIKNGTA